MMTSLATIELCFRLFVYANKLWKEQPARIRFKKLLMENLSRSITAMVVFLCVCLMTPIIENHETNPWKAKLID